MYVNLTAYFFNKINHYLNWILFNKTNGAFYIIYGTNQERQNVKDSKNRGKMTLEHLCLCLSVLW